MLQVDFEDWAWDTHTTWFVSGQSQGKTVPLTHDHHGQNAPNMIIIKPRKSQFKGAQRAKLDWPYPNHSKALRERYMTSRTRYEIIRHSGYLSPDLAQKKETCQKFSHLHSGRQCMHFLLIRPRLSSTLAKFSLPVSNEVGNRLRFSLLLHFPLDKIDLKGGRSWNHYYKLS